MFTEKTTWQKLLILRSQLATCMVALACDLICRRFICDRGCVLWTLPTPQHPFCTCPWPKLTALHSVWSITEALKINVHPQQREGETTIYQKKVRLLACSSWFLPLCSARALHFEVVSAKQHPAFRNRTSLVFPYTVVATVLTSFISMLQKSIAESPMKKEARRNCCNL